MVILLSSLMATPATKALQNLSLESYVLEPGQSMIVLAGVVVVLLFRFNWGRH